MLFEDSSVKSTDHDKLLLFADILTACTMYAYMQSDEVYILGALTCLLKTLKETDKLASRLLEQWPTYAATVRSALNKMDILSTNASK